MKRKLLALTLCAGLALGLTACGSSDPGQKLVGTWVCRYDYMDPILNEAVGGAEEMADYLSLDEFYIPMELTFTKDGIITLTVIQDEMDEQMENLKDAVLEATLSYVEAEIGTQYQDLWDLDELLGLMGTSREDLAAELDEAMDPIMEELYQEAHEEGQYKATEDMLYTSTDVDTPAQETDGDPYTLDGDTLTLDLGEDALGELTFTRAD